MGACLHIVQYGIRRLVHPVRGDAGFSQPVHVGGADLHLDRGTAGTEQDGMQRLVAVGFGDGDVILELAGYRLVQGVQHPQRYIAGRQVMHHDAKAVYVEDFGEGEVFFLHLAVDAEQVFFATGDGGIDFRLFEFFLHHQLDLIDQFTAVASCGLHRFGQHLIAIGVAVAEAQIFQFLVDRMQPQAVGNGRVYFEGFGSNAAALFGRHGIQGVHIVCAVGQLDQDDPHILRHRQQHFAEVLCLRMLLGRKRQLVELGYPFDQNRDRLAEPHFDFACGGRRVLHHVMQQRGAQCLGVKMPAGENAGNSQWMGNIGFAAFAELAFVGAAAEFVGFFDDTDFVCRQVSQGRSQRIKCVRHRRRTGRARRLRNRRVLRHDLG